LKLFRRQEGRRFGFHRVAEIRENRIAEFDCWKSPYQFFADQRTVRHSRYRVHRTVIENFEMMIGANQPVAAMVRR
jgi:hypothetical protein